MLVLMAKFEDGRLKFDDLFGGQSLPDSVDKLEFWADVVDVHDAWLLSVVQIKINIIMFEPIK